VTDRSANTLLKLNSNGSIAQTINVGNSPNFPVFDGANIWVPNRGSDSVTVVRIKDAVGKPLASAFELATLTGIGMGFPTAAAFDGERLLVTNNLGNRVSMWKAADLTPLGSFPTGANSQPFGVCSDGLNFWITLDGPTGGDQLARF
jgi:DNA-binding beta-propeller fold protein YncE